MRAAVTKAIEAAKAEPFKSGSPAEVRFEAGIYKMRVAGGETDLAQLISNAKDLVVNGGGAEFIIDNPQAGAFGVQNSRNITLKNFKIDYEPLPYTQGTVTAVDLTNYTCDVRLDDGFLEFDTVAFQNSGARGFGLVVRRGKGSQATSYGPTVFVPPKWTRLEGRLWRASLKREQAWHSNPIETAGMKVGDRYVHLARNYAAAVSVRHCDTVTLDGITIYSSPGLAFLPYLTKTMTLKNCRVMPGPGANRLLSTNADGIHARGVRGGLTLEGCTFEGMADDAINIHASAMPVGAVRSPTEVEVGKSHYTLQPGDRLAVMDSTSGRVRKTVALVALKDLGARWAMTFDAPVEGITTGQDFVNADNIYNLSECGAPFVVRDCHFKSFRGRGVLASSHAGKIENNRFDVREGWGVVFHHEESIWGEGPIAHDIMVRGNTFTGQGGQLPAIYFHPTTRGGTLAQPRETKNIRIEKNRFLNLSATAIDLNSARNIAIRDNIIAGRPVAPVARNDYFGVSINNCAAIIIDDFTVKDPGPKLKAAVRITASTQAAEVKVRKLKVASSSKAKPLEVMTEKPETQP